MSFPRQVGTGAPCLAVLGLCSGVEFNHTAPVAAPNISSGSGPSVMGAGKQMSSPASMIGLMSTRKPVVGSGFQIRRRRAIRTWGWCPSLCR